MAIHLIRISWLIVCFPSHTDTCQIHHAPSPMYIFPGTFDTTDARLFLPNRPMLFVYYLSCLSIPFKLSHFVPILVLRLAQLSQILYLACILRSDRHLISCGPLGVHSHKMIHHDQEESGDPKSVREVRKSSVGDHLVGFVDCFSFLFAG